MIYINVVEKCLLLSIRIEIWMWYRALHVLESTTTSTGRMKILPNNWLSGCAQSRYTITEWNDIGVTASTEARWSNDLMYSKWWRLSFVRRYRLRYIYRQRVQRVCSDIHLTSKSKAAKFRACLILVIASHVRQWICPQIQWLAMTAWTWMHSVWQLLKNATPGFAYLSWSCDVIVTYLHSLLRSFGPTFTSLPNHLHQQHYPEPMNANASTINGKQMLKPINSTAI